MDSIDTNTGCMVVSSVFDDLFIVVCVRVCFDQSDHTTHNLPPWWFC
jgi:hypothetical protein